jgi:hypothetical protein
VKKKEVEQLSCKMFTERKSMLIKQYETKILSLKCTLDHLKTDIDTRKDSREIRETDMIKILETKIIESSTLAAKEREASYAASQTTIKENAKLKEQVNELNNELTDHKARNVRLAISLDNQNKN